jgi:hypothetical protein
MKTADLLPILKVGEAYYIAIRRPLQPKKVGAVVRFVEYIGKSPAERGQGFWFKFIDYNFTGILKPECIVRIGKTPLLDGPEAVA